jgi:hypothetical protein
MPGIRAWLSQRRLEITQPALPYYPAALTNVLAVSATNDTSDAFASFSTVTGSPLQHQEIGSIQRKTAGDIGVSTAHPSPLPKLPVWRHSCFLSIQVVVDIIKQNADDLGAPGFDPYYGWGRINVYRALQAVQITPSTSTAVAITPVQRFLGVRNGQCQCCRKLNCLRRLSSMSMGSLTAACRAAPIRFRGIPMDFLAPTR